jgi:hypothetical protein
VNRAERVLVTKAADHLRTVGVSCPDLDRLLPEREEVEG